MRYAKTFLATFAVAFAAFLATPAQTVSATDSAIIIDYGSYIEVWGVYDEFGNLVAI